MITIGFDFHLLVLCRKVIGRIIGNGLDIVRLRMVPTRYVGKHELVGMNTV